MNKNSQLIKAQKLHQQGKLDEATALYQEILAEDSDNVEVRHAYAVALSQQGNTEHAIKELNKAIKTTKNIPALYNSKGNIYRQANQLEKALQAYQQAIDIDPNYAIAHNNLGNIFYRKDKLQDAREHYEKAIALSDEYTDAHFNLGILLAKLGELDQAVQELKKTIELAPQYYLAYGQLAEVYLQKEAFANAVQYFDKRIQLGPESADLYHDLGQALARQDKIEDAIACYEKALMLDHNHPEVNQNLANAYLKQDEADKALNYYFRQLERDPQPESYYNIGVLLAQQNRHREAITYLRQAKEVDPSYLPIYLNLGALFLKLNGVKEAAAEYQAALEICPDNAEIKHIVDALTNAETPDQAPTEFLQNLFDQYAGYYDKHLEYLHYKVPELIQQILDEEFPDVKEQWRVLDLGCGTGLSGECVQAKASELIGIDLSEEMINKAKTKDLYNELAVMDVSEALQKYKDNDLVLAADVFTYIGKLDNIFALAKAALKPNGLFLFSVEKTYTDPYELQETIRYAHAKVYLERLIKLYSFEVLRFDNIVLRKHKNKKIEGYLVLMQAT